MDRKRAKERDVLNESQEMENTGQRTRPELPLVTVITPAYNGEPYLEGVIESVLSQDYPNVEHIILDDGSTDGTLETIKKYAEGSEDRIRWNSHGNMGEAHTVNKGFSMASGDIIGVVNSDDPLLPGAISTMVTYLLAHPDALVAYPDWNVIDETGKTIQHIETYEYDYADMVRWNHCIPGPGVFFRRELVEKIGGRNPAFRYANDFDFWLRAGLEGPFVRVPEVLATFRYHPGARSASDVGKEMAEERQRLTEKFFANPEVPSKVRKLKREIYSSCYYKAGIQCGKETVSKRRYFLRALLYAPDKYLTEYRGRLYTMLPVLLGRFYEPFKFFVGPFYRRVRRLVKWLRGGA
jgi:glycosyltransferase involved in cell wall biosynthesis